MNSPSLPRTQTQATQTIFIDDGTSIELFHGNGKDQTPYAQLPTGGAFQLATDSNKTLYVPQESYPGSVDEYPWKSKTPKIIKRGIHGPQGVAADSDGTLYVSNIGRHLTVTITVYAPGATQPKRTIQNAFYGPMNVDRQGRLFIIQAGWYGIAYYEKGSSKVHYANFQGIKEPLGIATDSQNNYYLSDYDSNMGSVREYGPDGPAGGPTTRTIISDGEPNPWRPQDLALDNHGNLYVADQANYVTAVFAPGATSPYAVLPYCCAVAVTIDF